MAMTSLQERRGDTARREGCVAWRLTLEVLVLIAMASAALLFTAPSASALEKGLIDYRLEHSADPAQRAAIIHEIGPHLQAR